MYTVNFPACGMRTEKRPNVYLHFIILIAAEPCSSEFSRFRRDAWLTERLMICGRPAKASLCGARVLAFCELIRNG
ncbi:MAG: hypothetical protein COZ70_06275 [Deltaproteobacteria bacterium CG_4_8_14_3_um_filter_51_11]|nr:MAG: hypothetical protein AUK25_00835 [Desulfobacteraceae bacterium CG2_30_51_40]PIP45801.1 MAG: hypothetical protein COX16_11245 [Deltaproteobacteria bacterium CG23_combo_of_CG06-09_8_20_14_all_51_20]PIX19944.1 MAG: hypothetical protein COZ70_06275 [Deltaproteobacteria bacterium CG_4_8_14_3_um_filter_51_11]PIY23333.1 MAG: hypothetical protein COZ11_09910 [Deltaproteobacteria bacterium CG_4_10_14_3_um_filter_51_14]PJB36710.1 MAG: hypothetical protein CO107_06900 [Deltaproteobacteria bacteriu